MEVLLLCSGCLLVPVGAIASLVVWFVVAMSIRSYVSDKDIFGWFRSPINDFQLDDLLALEKSVDQTIRLSLDTVGIDAALMPPTASFGPERRRLI